jgi:mannose-6-phosphate isomerase
MDPKIIRFKPIFKERIWGGEKLAQFGYTLPSKKTGECWGLSAHPEGQSIGVDDPVKGLTLSQIYTQFPQWFNLEKKPQFPLLIKIIDAKTDLSVQVHPNDQYALAHENQYGKHEAWLVLAAESNTRIQLGHFAKSKDELTHFITHKHWDKLLRYESLHQDEIIDIPPGTLHALCAGTMVLEIQQSSDVTYRVYDYDRKDDKGNHRTLHLNQAIAVTKAPQVIPQKQTLNRAILNQVQTILKNPYFVIEALGVQSINTLTFAHHRYRLGTVIEGQITINEVTMAAGSHFLLPSNANDMKVTGQGWVIFAQSI